MVVCQGFSVVQCLVVADDCFGVVTGIEANAAEVVPGFEAMEFGAVVAIIVVGCQG